MKTQRFEFNITCRQENGWLWDSYHQHDEVELRLGLGDGYRMAFNERVLRLGDHDLLLFWGNVPHRIVGLERKPCRYGWVTMPLSVFLRCRLPEGFASRILRGEWIYVPDNGEFEHDLLHLDQWQRDLAHGAVERERCVQLELEARLSRLALDWEPGAAPCFTSRNDRLAAVFSHIAQHYQEKLCVEDIAREAGMHPKYLITQFRKHCGCGPMSYVNRLRAAHAKRLLVMGEMAALDVAEESGFGCVSSFYAVFKKLTGLSPAAYRQQMQATGERDRE